MRAAIVCALSGALMLCAQVAVASAPSVAARIDGVPLLSFSVDAMMRMAGGPGPATQRHAMLEQLLDNRLLAGNARARFGTPALSPGQGVGFSRDVTFDDQLVATLRTLYGTQIEQDLLQLGGIAAMLRMEARPDEAMLGAIFGKPDALLLDVTLGAPQRQQARSTVLLRLTLPGRPQRALTLFDVYERQNVQGRMAFFARDVDFMQQQARLHVGAQFVLDWSVRRFGAEAVADLRRVLSEQADAQALMRMHGLGEDAHDDSGLLDRLAARVGAAQIDAYYQRNRAQFKRVARVRGRHIQLRDEASARAVAAALAGGAEFAAMARQHSLAADSVRGGALGWVRHEGNPGWLAQLLFAQPAGLVSAPVRTPAAASVEAAWEIVLVEQREEGFQDRRSESVRYVASRAIARDMAAAQLQSLRKQLRRSARIEIVAPAPGAAS
jgi:hypothetical protein